MPIYEYRCESCGREWEAFHAIAHRDSETCCDTPSFRKVSLPAENRWLNYFSPELGCEITSPGHRRQVENELGLVATSHYKHKDDIPVGNREDSLGTKEEFNKVYEEVVATMPGDDSGNE